MKFVIQRAGPDSEQLPAAHTCFNVLDLPVCECPLFFFLLFLLYYYLFVYILFSLSLLFLLFFFSLCAFFFKKKKQDYASEEKLKQKLTTAILHAHSFGLV